VLLAIENYEIFNPVEIGGNGATAVPSHPHKLFNGSEKGRTCHGSSRILDTDPSTIPNRPDFSRIIGPLVFLHPSTCKRFQRFNIFNQLPDSEQPTQELKGRLLIIIMRPLASLTDLYK
jgi:hypothetical protein